MCDFSLSLVKGLNSFVRSGRLVKCVINKIVCLWLYSMLSTFPAKRRKGLLSLSRLRIITLSVCVWTKLSFFLLVNHLHKTHRKHAPPGRIALNLTLHPVVVVGSLVQHEQHFALLELQLVVVVGVAVVQGATSPRDALQEGNILKLPSNPLIEIESYSHNRGTKPDSWTRTG